MVEETTTKTNEHVIDATGESVGRVASNVASLLMNKKSPSFKRNEASGNKVVVENVDKMKIHYKRLDAKKYKRYSGYPGGLKEESMKDLIDRRGKAEVLQRAVSGMIPKNKLWKARMKNLTIK